MIAKKNWNKRSFTSQVIDTRFTILSPASNHVNESAGAIRRVMPRSATGRSRKA